MGVIGSDTRKLDAVARHKLKHFVKQLEPYRGRGTELVTVYVPAGYELVRIIQQLQDEQSTAENIKSKQTRTNVIDALERMIIHLRQVGKTPTNGLAAFSGNVAEREGQSDVRVWSMEPPIPNSQRLYRCDKEFILDPLRAIIEHENTYGLVVLDRRDAMVGLLKGKTIIPLVQTHSEVPGKHKSGGQCLVPSTRIKTPDGYVPLERLSIGSQVLSHKEGKIVPSSIIDLWHSEKRMMTIEAGHNRVEASEDHQFFRNDWKTFHASELFPGDYLIDENLQEIRIDNVITANRTFKMIDISVEQGNFIAEGVFVHNSAVRFERLREGATVEHFKKIAEYMKDQFLPIIADLKGIIIGGPGVTVNLFMQNDYITGDVKKKILGTKDLSYTGEFGMDELVQKSEDLLAAEEVAEEKKIMQKFFTELSKDTGLAAYGRDDVMKYLGYGAVDTILLSEDLDEPTIEEFETTAEKTGAKITLISTETREGVQLREMGKIAALLRYPMQAH